MLLSAVLDYAKLKDWIKWSLIFPLEIFMTIANLNF